MAQSTVALGRSRPAWSRLAEIPDLPTAMSPHDMAQLEKRIRQSLDPETCDALVTQRRADARAEAKETEARLKSQTEALTVERDQMFEQPKSSRTGSKL